MVALEPISLVHGDVLVDELIDLFVHVVRELSPNHPSVAENYKH